MSGAGAHIEITRRAGAWRDSLAAYDVLIDDEVVAQLTAGGSHAFSVAPGQHSVQLAIDWCRSRTLTVVLSRGDVVRLACAPSGVEAPGITPTERTTGGLLALWRMIVGSRDYIELQEIDREAEFNEP
jgi:hypothetical protein